MILPGSDILNNYSDGLVKIFIAYFQGILRMLLAPGPLDIGGQYNRTKYL